MKSNVYLRHTFSSIAIALCGLVEGRIEDEGCVILRKDVSERMEKETHEARKK